MSKRDDRSRCYDTVDYDIVRRILTEKLPALVAALERAIDQLIVDRA
jgi:uncharacterized protein with HEPN domain